MIVRRNTLPSVGDKDGGAFTIKKMYMGECWGKLQIQTRTRQEADSISCDAVHRPADRLPLSNAKNEEVLKSYTCINPVGTVFSKFDKGSSGVTVPTRRAQSISSGRIRRGNSQDFQHADVVSWSSDLQHIIDPSEVDLKRRVNEKHSRADLIVDILLSSDRNVRNKEYLKSMFEEEIRKGSSSEMFYLNDPECDEFTPNDDSLKYQTLDRDSI